MPPTDIDDLTGTGWRSAVGVDARPDPVQRLPGDGGVGGRRHRYLLSRRPRARSTTAAAAMPTSGCASRCPGRNGRCGVRYSPFEDSDQQDETWGLRAGLSFNRPDGALRFGLSSTRPPAEPGLRPSSAAASSSPGAVSTSVSASPGPPWRCTFSGALKLTYDLAQGRLRLGLAGAGLGRQRCRDLRTAAALGDTGAGAAREPVASSSPIWRRRTCDGQLDDAHDASGSAMATR